MTTVKACVVYCSRLFQNGEWNGLIEEMIQGKADMVITSIKINHERATAMDFSTPFLETGITIMVALRKGAISATAFLGMYLE